MSGGRIEGKACVVTGAASGIGRGIATRFAQEGGRVVCVDVDEAGLRETAEQAGGVAEPCVADVSDRAQITAAVQRCIAHHGQIDVLVNNAGRQPARRLPRGR